MTNQKLDPNRQWESDLEDRMGKSQPPSNAMTDEQMMQMIIAHGIWKPDEQLADLTAAARLIARLYRREYVKAQHEETGRLWHGPREEVPAHFSELRAPGVSHEPPAECAGCEEFVRLQVELCDLIGAPTNTDSIGLHESIKARLSQPPVPALEYRRLCDALQQAMLDECVPDMQTDDGIDYRFLDLMSDQDSTIETGQRRIEIFAERIADAVLEHLDSPALTKAGEQS